MGSIDTKKLLVIAALFAIFAAIKFLSGRPYDRVVKRRRRFAYTGREERAKQAPPPKPEDAEKDFFGDDKK